MNYKYEVSASGHWLATFANYQDAESFMKAKHELSLLREPIQEVPREPLQLDVETRANKAVAEYRRRCEEFHLCLTSCNGESRNLHAHTMMDAYKTAAKGLALVEFNVTPEQFLKAMVAFLEGGKENQAQNASASERDDVQPDTIITRVAHSPSTQSH